MQTRYESRVVNGVDTTGDVVRVKQDARDECNINTIMKKAVQRGGPIVDPSSVIGNRKPMFVDMTSQQDFMDVQNYMAECRATFESLPSEVRTAYKNDVSAFMGRLFEVQTAADLEAALMGKERPESAPVVNGGEPTVEGN